MQALRSRTCMGCSTAPRWLPLRRASPARRVSAASPVRAASTSHQHPGHEPPTASTQQQDAPRKRQLDWVAQHRAATVAGWSGLCYLQDSAELAAQLAARGLSLVATGRNEFTSWYVADGAIDPAGFASSSLQRLNPTAAATGVTPATTAAAAVSATPQPQRERFVMLRGVQWAAPELDTGRMWRSLMRVWPAPLAPAAPDIVAHDGVREMAAVMFDQLRPYLDHAEDAGIPVVFGGHSLGGAMSKLLLAMYRINARRPETQPVPSCLTFGSPPVLAHANGGGGDRVLAPLRLTRANCRNFILQNDPIPRALLSVDPTFQLLTGLPGVQPLLELRAWLTGSSSGGAAPLSPSRFLFETVGEVHFIRWSAHDGQELIHLEEPHEIAQHLSLLPTAPPFNPTPAATADPTATAAATAAPPGAAAAEGTLPSGDAAAAQQQQQAPSLAAAAAARLSPVAAAQAWLDHHHGSYAQELEAAAARALLRAVQAAGPAAAGKVASR